MSEPWKGFEEETERLARWAFPDLHVVDGRRREIEKALRRAYWAGLQRAADVISAFARGESE